MTLAVPSAEDGAWGGQRPALLERARPHTPRTGLGCCRGPVAGGHVGSARARAPPRVAASRSVPWGQERPPGGISVRDQGQHLATAHTARTQGTFAASPPPSPAESYVPRRLLRGGTATTSCRRNRGRRRSSYKMEATAPWSAAERRGRSGGGEDRTVPVGTLRSRHVLAGKHQLQRRRVRGRERRSHEPETSCCAGAGSAAGRAGGLPGSRFLRPCVPCVRLYAPGTVGSFHLPPGSDRAPLRCRMCARRCMKARGAAHRGRTAGPKHPPLRAWGGSRAARPGGALLGLAQGSPRPA